MAKEIIEAYEAVFDEQGRVKDCSMRTHSILIVACKKEDPYTDFGDEKYGRICMESIDRMQELYESAKSV